MAVKIKLPFCFSQLSPNRLKETFRTKSTPENDLKQRQHAKMLNPYSDGKIVWTFVVSLTTYQPHVGTHPRYKSTRSTRIYFSYLVSLTINIKNNFNWVKLSENFFPLPFPFPLAFPFTDSRLSSVAVLPPTSTTFQTLTFMSIAWPLRSTSTQKAFIVVPASCWTALLLQSSAESQ